MEIPGLRIGGLLEGIERPARYIGTEIGVIKKDAEIRFALCFPDIYEIGMSNYGLRVLYRIINALPYACCERVFLPWLDMERAMRRSKIPLFSLESKRPVSEFDVVGISVQTELTYTNILHLLELSGIPLFSKDRKTPLVIGGGPSCTNPEPIADFFDIFIIGEAEDAVCEVLECFLHNQNKPKESLLIELSKIEGVYVPSLYEIEYGRDGVKEIRGCRIKRRVFERFSSSESNSCHIVPFIPITHDRATLEIQRGCTRGCRFCSAGVSFRPVREKPKKLLLSEADRVISETGYEEIGLLSLSASDHSEIEELLLELKGICPIVSVPSLHPDTDPAILSLIKPGSVTLAPEVGTERLSNVINKGYDRERLKEIIETALSSRFRLVKLYFMVGFCQEDESDLNGIVELIKELRTRKGSIKVSISPFVPKPHTPFQWDAFLSEDELTRRIKYVADNNYQKGVEIEWRDVSLSLVEAVLSKGDRRLSSVILTAYRAGARFDGHGELFDYKKWLSAFKSCNIDISFYTRKKGMEDLLPWDHIDVVEKGFLEREKKKAENGEATSDCRDGVCHQCGLEEICQKSYKSYHPKKDIQPFFPIEGPFSKINVIYTKGEEIRHLSHLDTVRAFCRTLRRAGILVAYTSGFHQRPKVSFGDALPLGKKSEECKAVIKVASNISHNEIIRRFNSCSPDGLKIVWAG